MIAICEFGAMLTEMKFLQWEIIYLIFWGRRINVIFCQMQKFEEITKNSTRVSDELDLSWTKIKKLDKNPS